MLKLLLYTTLTNTSKNWARLSFYIKNFIGAKYNYARAAANFGSLKKLTKISYNTGAAQHSIPC